MKPRKLPYDQFFESLEFVPSPTVNLFATREDGAILLIKRKKPPFVGSWRSALQGSALCE